MPLPLPLILVIAVVAAGWLVWRRSPWPLQTFSAAARLTFGASAAALLFAGSGLVGYRLSRHDRFVLGTPWAGETIWWQVAVGAVFAVLAVHALRQANRLAGSRPQSQYTGHPCQAERATKPNNGLQPTAAGGIIRPPRPKPGR